MCINLISSLAFAKRGRVERDEAVLRTRYVSTLMFVLFCFFIFFDESHALSSLQLNEGQEEYDLNPYIDILVDQKNQFTIEDVAEGQYDEQFTQSTGGIPNFGYTSADYWVRFHLENASSLESWLLEIPYPPHDYITLYTPDDTGDFMGRKMGDLFPFTERDRDHRNFIYELSLEKGQSQTFYMKFESEGSMQLPLTLWSPEAFSQKSQNEYLLLGLYYGIAAVMILYNLFLFFSLRLRSYVWYTLFILMLVFVHFTLNGLAYQYMWPNSPWWNNRAIVFFMAIANAAAFLFTKSFLHTKSYTPRLDRLFSWFIAIQLIQVMVLAFSYETALNLVMISTVILVFTVIFAALSCWKQGYKPARYFFFGWVIFLVGVLLSSLADAGMFPVTFFTKYASQIGSSFELILFSLALGDKIKLMRLEKEEAERKAKESQEIAVQHLQKTNQLKDEFLANTSHELRTPLHGIIGIAESIYNGVAGEANDSMKRNVSMIITSGRRLAHLVNDLLDFSKLKHKEIDLIVKPVHMKEIADVVMFTVKSLTRQKPIQLINNIPSDLPVVAADENRIQQVLYNIVGNAMKFTDGGFIKLSSVVGVDDVQFTVTDSGIGMSDDDIKVIFNDFEQGSNTGARQYGGTGLGMSITKRLIELHGGTITVQSKIGKGTSVTFSLPRYQGELQQVKSVPTIYKEGEKDFSSSITQLTSLEQTKGRILIADDEPVNRQVLLNQLTLDGYEVTTARDGEEVLALVDTKEPFDLVILDVMMPKKTGYEVSKLLREHYSLTELPILIVTARMQIEDVVMAFQAGANDYLSKPCHKEELITRVKTLLTLKEAMNCVVEQKEELRLVNEELTKLNQDLETRVKDRTEALERKTETVLKLEASRRNLLSNISHELGTPMTSIQGYVKAMMDGLIQPDDRRYLDLVYGKIMFIDRLIQDLYDLSKLEARQVSFHWSELTIRQLMMQLLHKFELDVTGHGLNFSLKSSFSHEYELMDTVKVDIDRIQQVLTNLIANAIRYTHEDGEISIELKGIHSLPEQTDEAAYEEVAATTSTQHSKQNRFILVRVRDNGEGIEPDELPFIFDRFYRGGQTRGDQVKNTGLGLAISKEIVEYHKGSIWAESVVDEGSSFYFTLPLKNDRLRTSKKGVKEVGE